MNSKEEYLKTRWTHVSRMVSSRNPSNWVELMEETPDYVLAAVETGYRHLIDVLKTIEPMPARDLRKVRVDEAAARLEEELESFKDHAVKVSEYKESFEFKVIKEEIAEQMRNHVARLHHPKEIACPVQGGAFGSFLRYFKELI